MTKSNKSIYSALAANLLISITKFIAGYFTNSSAMVSEGIHSLVDTVNQLLLLYGLKRSRKPADAMRPLGYGKELYFWSLIVSIMIFGFGGGISAYQGVLHIMHPKTLEKPVWNYIVLGLSFMFEGTSLLIAIREFDKTRNAVPWWKAIIQSKDPSTFLVLFEDSAAVMGLTVVFILMVIGHQFKLPVTDGIASVIVGLILIFASSILARETRSLLLGEGISPQTQNKIRTLVEKDNDVLKVQHLMSTYQSPDEVILMLLVRFKPESDNEFITEAIERIRADVKKEYPLIHFILIQPQPL